MRVYHLLSTKWGEENIRKRRLKISRFADLNDPFELLGANLRDNHSRTAFHRWKVEIDQKFGLLCFSKAWRNPLLWSHYGDRHYGLCLGFDVPDDKIVAVKYQEERIEFTQSALNEKLMIEILAAKFVDWKYEQEMRIFTNLSDRDPKDGKYYIEFGNDLDLREIVVGALSKISRADLEVLIRSAGLEVSKIHLIKARLAFKSFAIVPDKRGLC